MAVIYHYENCSSNKWRSRNKYHCGDNANKKNAVHERCVDKDTSRPTNASRSYERPKCIGNNQNVIGNSNQRKSNKRVRFDPVVAVEAIISHRQYSTETREQLWWKRSDIRRNISDFKEKKRQYMADCNDNTDCKKIGFQHNIGNIDGSSGRLKSSSNYAGNQQQQTVNRRAYIFHRVSCHRDVTPTSSSTNTYAYVDIM